MNGTQKAAVVLVGALAAGSLAQRFVAAEAGVLGLTALEVALLGALVGAAVTRLTA